MAFSSVLLSKEQLPGGIVQENYSWNGSGVTTGTITANTTQQPEIIKITDASPSSDSDSAALTHALDVGANQVKLTFASGDTGKCSLRGKAA